MLTYVIRRTALLPVVALGVVTVVFFVMRVVPADVARLVAGIEATPDQVEEVRTQLGLDDPLWKQYGDYTLDAARGEFGKSLYTNREVRSDVLAKFQNTAVLAVASTALAVVLGVSLGVLAAAKYQTPTDSVASIVAAASLAMPRFWLALMLIYLFAEKLQWLPALGGTDPKHLVLPAISMGLPASAVIARMTRATMLEVLHQDYIRTARAKGLATRVVLIRHALRPASLQIVTVIGLQLGFMLGGSVIVETIFAYPGLGTLIVRSVQTRDFPVVQGGVILVGVSFALVNLIVDIGYAYLDPRVRLAHR
jgi:peptide/nickel transport system permease protein